MSGGIQTTVDLKTAEPSTVKYPGGVILRGSLKIEAKDKDGNVTGTFCQDDLTTKQLAQLIMLGVLASAQTIKDTANATHNETTAATTGSSPLIWAGTNNTSAAFSDFVLGTPTESVAATVGAISSNTFTVTGTVTAGSARAYTEVGIQVTVNTHLYLITHDVFSVLNVSSGGTLAVTYTFTFT